MMKAVVLQGPQEAVLQEVAVPEPGPEDVLVRLEGAGICGSELPLWEGRPWFEYPQTPGVPGHEGWGHVEAVGDAVSDLSTGDRVAMISHRAHAEFDVAPASACVRLPDAVRGPFPGEALGCAMNIFKRSGITRGMTIAVVGAGFMGALLVQLAARCGATVVAVSRRSTSRDVAEAMGAKHVESLEDHDQVVKKVEEITERSLCPVVIEATGVQGPLDLAARLTGVRGRLVIAGYHQDGHRQVDMQLWNWRGLDVINAHERATEAYVSGVAAAVDAVARGELDPAPLITDRVAFDEIAEGYRRSIERPEGFVKAVWERA